MAISRRQMEILAKAAARESGKVLVAKRDTTLGRGREVKAGTRLPVVGRTSSHLHPSRQGYVVLVGRAQVTVLDDRIAWGGGDLEVQDS